MSKERAAGERNSRRDEIEENLHLIGVWDGSPKRRLALAIQCDVHGITVADIEPAIRAVARPWWPRPDDPLLTELAADRIDAEDFS